MKGLLKTTIWIVFAGTLLSASCKSKEASSGGSSDTGGTKVETPGLADQMTAGTVTAKYANEGCAFLISVQENGEEKLYMPIQLADEFKKDGMAIKMIFHTSRIRQEECLKGQPIVIEKIVER